LTLQVALPGHMGGDGTYDTVELTDTLPGDSAFSVGNCTGARSFNTLTESLWSRVVESKSIVPNGCRTPIDFKGWPSAPW
jgi:hypothetical protein